MTNPMKAIGVKRALLLGILLAINLAIAAVYFLQIEPMKDDAQTQLDTVNGQINTQSQRISDIKRDLKTFQDTLPAYRDLERKGFMLSQDRFRMSQDLDTLRIRSQLGGFSFTIADVKSLENRDADGAQMQLVDSRIKIENVESLLDVNFYQFLDLMQSDFPSHLRVQSFEVTRKDPLNADTLAKIVRKDPVKLITAKAQFDWLTLIPKQTQAPAGQPGGI